MNICSNSCCLFRSKLCFKGLLSLLVTYFSFFVSINLTSQVVFIPKWTGFMDTRISIWIHPWWDHCITCLSKNLLLKFLIYCPPPLFLLLIRYNYICCRISKPAENFSHFLIWVWGNCILFLLIFYINRNHCFSYRIKLFLFLKVLHWSAS